MEKTTVRMYIGAMVREILDRQTDIENLCRELAVRRLYVFGSATSRASLSEVEDLDFLVEFWSMPPVQYAHRYCWLAEELEELIGAPVNLLETEMLDNPFLKNAVERSRVPIYEPF